MDINNLKTCGTYFLIILYIGINTYYKKCYNIIIFLGVFVFTFNILNDLEKSIVISYIVSIAYGIVTNFHLLENFDGNVNKNDDLKKQIFKPDNSMKNFDHTLSKIKSRQLSNIKESKDYLEVGDSIDKTLDNLLSDGLILKYLEKLRKANLNSIVTKSINIFNLKPIFPNISNGKIKLMKNSIKNKKTRFMNTPLIISNDNFILDGHHRWFLRKYYANSNNKLFNKKFINVKMVDLSMKKIINDLREFKIEYNNKLIQDNSIDKNRFMDAKKSINTIRSELNKLDDFYDELKKISVV